MTLVQSFRLSKTSFFRSCLVARKNASTLVDEIYGDRLDSETKQNRFKSLIGTFRKKCPEMIVYDQGRYRLADEIFSSNGSRGHDVKIVSLVSIFISVFSVVSAAAPQIDIETGEHEPVAALRSKESVAGIVSAGSTFTDSSDGRMTINTVGSASLVRIKKTGALAVMTAAHVVGGSRGRGSNSEKSEFILARSTSTTITISRFLI